MYLGLSTRDFWCDVPTWLSQAVILLVDIIQAWPTALNMAVYGHT